MILVPLCYLKFLDRSRGLLCRNFKWAALGGPLVEMGLNTRCDQVGAGAGFFFLGLTAFGSATGSAPRSIEVSRPAVKV